MRNYFFLFIGVFVMQYAFAKAHDPAVTSDFIPPDLGPDINICGTFTTLDGSTPGALTYQWQVFDVPSGDYVDINGATSPMLTLTNSSSGSYQLVVTDAGGVETSDDIVVTFFDPPVVTATPVVYNECDGTPGDGTATFNLLSQTLEILNGQDPSVYGVTYFNTLAEANTNTNAIVNPDAYDSMGQTVYARVFVIALSGTDCYEIQTVNLSVLPDPVINDTPSDLEVCDTDNDGIAPFDNLTSQDDLIHLGNTSITISYHLTLSDAENDLNPITDGYVNVSANMQTVFFRAVGGNGCFRTGSFDLIVLDTALPNTTLTPFNACDVNNDGVETFDLTTQEAQLLGALDPAVYTVQWFATEAQALAGTPELGDPADFVTSGGDVWGVVTEEGQSATTRCPSVPVALAIQVFPVPVPTQPEAYEVCDDDNNEFALFDLRSRDDEITNGLANLQVSYHSTLADAQNENNPLPDMFENTVAATQTVFVRVEDVATGCFETITLTLVVVPLPTPMGVAPLEACDSDNDGLAAFNLLDPTFQNAITNGEPVALTFHETEAEAILGTPAIATPDTYITGSRSIWVRATDTNTTTATDCFAVIEVVLVVHPAPTVPATIDALPSCDSDSDGDALFDLTERSATIYGSQSDMVFTLTFHETAQSANSEVTDATYNPIADPINYLANADATIFVRLADNATGCFAVSSFEIQIISAPSFVAPTSLEACDTDESGDDADGITTFDLTTLNEAITAGDTSLEVSYYVSQSDLNAEIAIPTPENYQGTGENPQTVFIQIKSTAPGLCAAQTTVQLITNPLPALVDPIAPFVVCDPDNDGFAEFLLDDHTPVLLNGQSGITLSYFETAEDAASGDNQIDPSVPYNNITTNNPTLYVVATFDVTGCAKMYELPLEAHPIPVFAETFEPLTACDNDENGVEQFDLGEIVTQIFGTGPPSFDISFHVSDLSANAPRVDASFMPIDPAEWGAFESATATLYVRGEFLDGSGCFTVHTFDVVVNALPTIVAPSEPLTTCDDDTDEVAIFNLRDLDDAITGGDSLLEVSYYQTQADLDAGSEILTPEAYENTANPQTVYIAVTDLEGCERTTQVTLRVLPLPTPETFSPEPLVFCDDDYDGIFTFDLTPALEEIDSDGDVVILVYENAEDAEVGDPALAIPDVNNHTNTNSPNQQTLYARVNHDPAVVSGNSCYVIVPFDLVVNALPVLSQATPYEYTLCEVQDDNDAVGIFDLTTLADEIGLLAEPQDPAFFTVTYHATQAQADLGEFALETPYENTIEPETLFIRVAVNDTGCFITTTIILSVEPRPLINVLEDLVQCADDPGINGTPMQDTATFNLNVQDQIATGGAVGVTVRYYLSEMDAIAQENAIVDTDAFQNTSNPQTIWVNVTNDVTACDAAAPVSFDLIVNELPYTDLSSAGGDICVDPFTEMVLDPVTISAVPENIVPNTTYSYEWTLDGAVVAITEDILVEQVGLYQVTVTATYNAGQDTETSCTYIAETLYTPKSAPRFEALVVEDAFNQGGFYTVQIDPASIAGFGTLDFEFSIDNGPYQQDLIFTDVRPGEHTVFGRRVDGDCSITTVDINIVDYPRYFTPNNDGIHDTWNIIGIGRAPNLNAKIYIFDRHGKLLKQLSPTDNGWDGTVKGQPLPSSSYWFTVEYNEPLEDGTLSKRVYKGHFTLKR